MKNKREFIHVHFKTFKRNVTKAKLKPRLYQFLIMFYDVYLCAHTARKLPFIVLTGSACIQLVAREQALVSLRRIARVILAAFVARALTPNVRLLAGFQL